MKELTKQEVWKSLSLRERLELIHGMRLVGQNPTLWARISDIISIREWIWRYKAAKITAYLEYEYDPDWGNDEKGIY